MEIGPDKPLPESKPEFEALGLAASAGGLKALIWILSNLPDNFPAAVLVVQHLDPRHPSLMAEILSRHSALPVGQAAHGEAIQPGKVYIAPPDQHLLVEPGGILALTRTELVHFVRPSADLLFESIAAVYKERCLVVVLTGTGRDGSMGVQAVKKMGGIVIAQDHSSSEFFGMPGAAIGTGAVDYVLPLDKIPEALVNLVQSGENNDVE